MGNDIQERFHAGRTLFLVILTLLLVVLPLVLFRPMKQQKNDQESKGRFTFMTNTPAESNDKYGLLYWERTGDPMLFAKADFSLGFSAFFKPGMRHFRPDSVEDKNLPELPLILPGIEFRPPAARLPFELLHRPEIPLVTPAKTGNVTPRKAPLFFLEDGSLLSIKTELPPAELAAGAENQTVLQVSEQQDSAPPVVRIVQPSGNPRLDQSALRALSRAAVSDKRIKGFIRVEWEPEPRK